MRNRVASLSLIVVLLAGISVVAGYLWLQRYLDSPLPLASAVVIEIPSGSSMAGVATLLQQHAELPHPRVLTLWARYHDIDTAIRAGEFALNPGFTPRSALNHLLHGPFVQYPVSFIEGTRVTDALSALWSSPKVQPTLQGLSEAELLAALKSPRASMEGLLFPDTYFYTAGTTDLAILRRAAARLDQVLAEEWALRQDDLPYTSPYEALIMASIIEKESGMVSERAEIAGVFVRRLHLGMRLQSDPTVIYGMGDAYDGNIRREDLETTTAYNTYRINGLPPSPIALSGRDAIHASLHPAPGTSLYFVATEDGRHVFSDTLDEHNAAVRQHQLGQQP